jgi:hypothetical protein
VPVVARRPKADEAIRFMSGLLVLVGTGLLRLAEYGEPSQRQEEDRIASALWASQRQEQDELAGATMTRYHVLTMNQFKDMNWKLVSTVLAVVILGVVGVSYGRDRLGLTERKGTDAPPAIEFTWTPLGRVFLEEIRGHVRMTDDHALDFTTYSMTVVEAQKTLDLPIPGLSGREYEQDISFVQFATNTDILRKGEVTIEFRIKDDAGQETVLSKVIKLRNDIQLPQLEFKDAAEQE